MPRPISNPPNPWSTTEVEYLERAPDAQLEVHEQRAGEILSRNESPDIPFRWSLNPYRGCFHACAYCYARPGHETLGWGAGTDFDRKIVVKVNAAERLRATFERRSWRGEPIAFSGMTDCYQPLEAAYGLTRACLEVCLEYRNPVQIITKGALIQRDEDLLAALARDASVSVSLSIPFLDDASSRAIEPGASLPGRRFEAMRTLAKAGVRVGVAVAPIIPGLNESTVPEVLARAADAGAQFAFPIMLRLPSSCERVFFERLVDALPGSAAKVERAIRDMRGGALNDPRFGGRMAGHGPRWKSIESLFRLQCRKLDLSIGEHEVVAEGATTFRRPRVESAQGELFS
jgi:DNA repair photolyase